VNFVENQKLIRLAYGGMFAAAIAVATMFFKVPIIVGYIHLGDGLIFLAAAVMGPFAALAAGIGSALADLGAGYLIYIPVTFCIKALMALIASWGFRRKLGFLQTACLYTFCEALMVVGYFLFEWVIYGFETASVAIVFNTVQGAVGMVVGCVLVSFFKNRLLEKHK
jgi:uncharacterized membrane protein